MSATTVSRIDPSDKSSLKRFVSLERKLMSRYPKYISEIDDDVIKMLTRKSLMAKEMEFGLFIVSKAGADVGRCAAIINKKFQAQKQAGAGFIGYFAAAEHCAQEVAEMVRQAENWLKEKKTAQKATQISVTKPIKQQLSHQSIYATAILLQLKGKTVGKNDWEWKTARQLQQLPFPKLLNDFLKAGVLELFGLINGTVKQKT